MRKPILSVALRKVRGTLQDDEVLGVGVLCRLREVETPGDNSCVVNNYDLVMGNGMLAIDLQRHSGIREERRTTVLGRHIGFVQEHLNVDTPLLSIQERFGDGRTGEGIRLDQYLLLGRCQFVHDGIGAPAAILGERKNEGTEDRTGQELLRLSGYTRQGVPVYWPDAPVKEVTL